MAGIPQSFGNSQPVQPGIGVGSPLRLPRVQTTPGQQGASASNVPGAPPAGRDSANVKPGLPGATARIASLEKAAHQAAGAVDELDRVGGLITELKGLIGQAQKSGDSAVIADVQSRIDQIIGTISNAEASVASVRQPSQAQLPVGYTLVRNELHTTRASGFYNGEPGSALDLHVNVTTSAQQGGFLLSFGGASLNLGGAGAFDGATSEFRIQLTGKLGVRELSFASGTQLSDIVDAINSFSVVTGVQAVTSGATGVGVSSVGFGSGDFASVRIVDSGQLNTAVAWAGIYERKPDNALVANPTDRTLFSAANNTITDYGQDMVATINGVLATTRGLNISASTADWRVNLDLTAASARTPHQSRVVATFRANSGDVGRAAESGVPGIEQDARGLVETLAESLATVRAQAADHLAAARQQVRDALESIPGASPQQSALDTLAAYRKSLLGE